MPSVDTPKSRLVAAVADVLTERGSHVPLRTIAEAVGTSHRMLEYHFGSRDALIEEALLEVSARLQGALDASDAVTRVDGIPAAITELDRITEPGVNALWLDVIAGSLRGEAVFVAAARRIAESWVRWIERRLALEHTDALAVFALAEGLGTLGIVLGTEARDAALARLGTVVAR